MHSRKYRVNTILGLVLGKSYRNDFRTNCAAAGIDRRQMPIRDIYTMMSWSESFLSGS